MTVEICNKRNRCYNGIHNACEGCNVYNMLFDEDALIDWCRKHNQSVLEMINHLHEECLDLKLVHKE